jgi:hypothetical protein
MGMGMGVTASALQLTAEAEQLMADFDPADDPAVRCEHPGLVRVLLSPYPMAIEQYLHRVVLRYEEWAQERSIPLGHAQDSVAEASPLRVPTAIIRSLHSSIWTRRLQSKVSSRSSGSRTRIRVFTSM